MARFRSLTLPASAQPADFPGELSPMLLHRQKQPFTDEQWIFEPKLDGLRALAFINKGDCKLLSRNGREMTATFPSIARDLAKHTGSLVLDAEIIAVDEQGRPDFDALQTRWFLTAPKDVAHAERQVPVLMYAFDILHLDGFDLRKCELMQRKELLAAHFRPSESVRSVEMFNDGVALYEACRREGLEGIVAKRKVSQYKSGIRTKDWIKIKLTETETVLIVGYRKNDGLLLAKSRGGGLSFVGTLRFGFSREAYERLSSMLLPRSSSPLADNKVKSGVEWFEPNVEVEVEFIQWTSQGMLRFPVFKQFVNR